MDCVDKVFFFLSDALQGKMLAKSTAFVQNVSKLCFYEDYITLVVGYLKSCLINIMT